VPFVATALAGECPDCSGKEVAKVAIRKVEATLEVLSEQPWLSAESSEKMMGNVLRLASFGPRRRGFPKEGVGRAPGGSMFGMDREVGELNPDALVKSLEGLGLNASFASHFERSQLLSLAARGRVASLVGSWKKKEADGTLSMSITSSYFFPSLHMAQLSAKVGEFNRGDSSAASAVLWMYLLCEGNVYKQPSINRTWSPVPGNEAAHSTPGELLELGCRTVKSPGFAESLTSQDLLLAKEYCRLSCRPELEEVQSWLSSHLLSRIATQTRSAGPETSAARPRLM
jgi:hypothetical protein